MKTLTIHAGSRIGVGSDQHYGHKRILGYCRRPWLYFDTDNRRREEAGEDYVVSDAVLAAHDTAIVENINRTDS